MNIHDKLEEMRSKPQHVKLQYVWISVAISMIFIFLIWLFSLQMLFQKDNSGGASSGSFESIRNSLQNANSKRPSLESVTGDAEGILSTTPAQNNRAIETENSRPE